MGSFFSQLPTVAAELSEKRVVGETGYRRNGLSEKWVVGEMGFVGEVGYRRNGLSEMWVCAKVRKLSEKWLVGKVGGPIYLLLYQLKWLQ